MPGISYSMEPAMGEKHDCYEILLNYNCNARCSFCSQGSFDKSANAKFPDVAKEIYLGKKKGYARLGLSGGEPLLRKDLCKIISVGRAVGFRFIRLQTNGILLADKGLCRALAASGLTFCKFTFASHKAAVHDALIGRPGAWRRAMAGLAQLRELKIGLGVNILLNRRNYRSLERTVRFFLDQGVSNFVVIFPLYEGNMRENAADIGVKLGQASPFILKTLRMMQKAGLPQEMKILNVPPCFLKGHERQAMDLYRFNTVVTEPSGRKWNLDDETHGNRVHGPPCRACALGSRCQGPDANYVSIWGWSGFRPVRRTKSKPDRDARTAPIGYLTDNEKCLMEILRQASNIPTQTVLERAKAIPFCQDCKDGNAVLNAAQRLTTAGWVEKRFSRGKFYWSLTTKHGSAPSHL